MRWLSFERGDRASFGIVKGDGVVDVGATSGLPDLKAAIASGRFEALGQEADGDRRDEREDEATGRAAGLRRAGDAGRGGRL